MGSFYSVSFVRGRPGGGGRAFVGDPLRGVTDQLAGGSQVELFAHVTTMRVDRLHRQFEPL